MDSTEQLTACMNCGHHRNTQGDQVQLPRSMWYFQICAAPAAQRPDVFDPVVGRAVKQEPPNCRDINRDGHCEHFEKG